MVLISIFSNCLYKCGCLWIRISFNVTETKEFYKTHMNESVRVWVCVSVSCACVCSFLFLYLCIIFSFFVNGCVSSAELLLSLFLFCDDKFLCGCCIALDFVCIWGSGVDGIVAVIQMIHCSSLSALRHSWLILSTGWLMYVHLLGGSLHLTMCNVWKCTWIVLENIE